MRPVLLLLLLLLLLAAAVAGGCCRTVGCLTATSCQAVAVAMLRKQLLHSAFAWPFIAA